MSERTVVRQLTEGACGRGDDLVLVVRDGSALGLVLADGAGGGAGAREAAQAVLTRVRQALPTLRDVAACSAVLTELDRELLWDPAAGETTAIVVVLDRGALVGASVGDSAAWILGPRRSAALTAGQRRARLGTGEAIPTPFQAALGPDTLVLATDGLWDHAPLEAIARIALHPEPDRVIALLVDAPRLRSGTLPDDVGIIVVRDRPLPRIPWLERTYCTQMAEIRARVHDFGRRRGWQPLRRGRHAHASIGGPIGERRGVIDFEMMMEPWDWDAAPSWLDPSSPFVFHAVAYRDVDGERRLVDEPLREVVTFERLQEDVVPLLQRGWMRVATPTPDWLLLP